MDQRDSIVPHSHLRSCAMEPIPCHIFEFELVRKAKARYCRYLDTKQWSSFAELLAPDAEIRVIDPEGGVIAAFNARDPFVASAEAFLSGTQSVHQVHNDELTLLSDTEVHAIWSMEEFIVFPQVKPEGSKALRGYGHYEETWIRSPEGWRIARLELRRTILQTSTEQIAC